MKAEAVPQALGCGVRSRRDGSLTHDPLDELPSAATRKRPELRAQVFEAVDLMAHPERMAELAKQRVI